MSGPTSTAPAGAHAVQWLLASALLVACGASGRVSKNHRLMPASMSAPSASATAQRPPIRFRIYADAGWQGQKGDWRATIETMVREAGQRARYDFGVDFMVEHIAPWPDAGAADRLDDRLDRLVRLDAGAADVWVVGLVGGVASTSNSFDRLGLAHTPGRHFVMRSMASLSEANAIATIKTLGPDQRNALLRARMNHRRSVVFLHEWGHTLGAVHAREHDVVMAPTYGSHIEGFGPAAVGVGHAVLGVDAPADPDDAALIDLQYQAAIAWYEAHPDARVEHGARTRFLAGRRSMADPEPAPSSSRPEHDLDAAIASGRVTAAVRAAAGTDAAPRIAQWAMTTRRRFAMPASFPPDDEADYVAAQRAVDAALARSDGPAAERQLAALEARWPAAAAGPLLRCDLAGRRGRFDRAERLCGDATTRDPEAVGAWLMLGMIAIHVDRPTDAIAPLERVIALDPGQTAAWRALGQVHRRLVRMKDHADLARRYRELTGQALPE